MSCQMKPGKEEMAMLPELLILHIHELKTKEDIDVIETLRASGLFTIQFVLGPVPIDSSVLLPGPLPFARPKQSFERFGPLEFTMDEICNDHALVVIENDKDYCRVDSLGSYAELITVLEELKQPGTSRRLFGSCQLADTLMK